MHTGTIVVGDTVHDRHVDRRHRGRFQSFHSVELVRSAKPITQIAQNAGYDNASKFSEAFRKRYGTTPSQYRTHANGLAKRSREIRME